MKVDIVTLSSLLACKANQHNFHKLWKSISAYNKESIAEKEGTPGNILEILSEDKDFFIRSNVAYNPSTPTYILEILSKDQEHTIRNGVALNRSTSIDTLKNLMWDSEQNIRDSAARQWDVRRFK
jgi:hypothetical protein